jgi:hypothetical protein
VWQFGHLKTQLATTFSNLGRFHARLVVYLRHLHTEKALIWHRESLSGLPSAPGRRTIFSTRFGHLKLQGYAGETGDDEWLTTAAGEIASASKRPRPHRESVYGALSTLFTV